MTDLFSAASRDLVRDEVRDELSKRPDPSVPRLLSVEAAAEALGLSRATLYKELQAGRIRSVRISRRRLIPTSALADFIATLDAVDGENGLVET